MFFRSKQIELESQLTRYREKAASCVHKFRDSFKEYCESSDIERLEQRVKQVHHEESEADDIRREIEVMMYSRALFPESRGDVLGLLEAMDRVPNQAEAAVRLIVNQAVAVPEDLHSLLFRLVDVCCRCVEDMFEAASKLFTDFSSVTAMVGKIDELESQADAIEMHLTRRIFTSDLKDLDKLLLRDLTQSIATISDRAENVADRMRIIAVKRMV